MPPTASVMELQTRFPESSSLTGKLVVVTPLLHPLWGAGCGGESTSPGGDPLCPVPVEAGRDGAECGLALRELLQPGRGAWVFCWQGDEWQLTFALFLGMTLPQSSLFPGTVGLQGAGADLPGVNRTTTASTPCWSPTRSAVLRGTHDAGAGGYALPTGIVSAGTAPL